MALDKGDLMCLAVDQLPDGIMVLDASEHVVGDNAQARLISGIRADGTPQVLQLFHGQAIEDVERGLKALHAGTIPEFSVIEGDPSTGRLYEYQFIPMRSSGGGYVATVVRSRDVTESKLQVARDKAHISGLQQQVADLQSALQERFVNGMMTLVDVLEARDRYTCGHSVRVAMLAGKVAARVVPVQSTWPKFNWRLACTTLARLRFLIA